MQEVELELAAAIELEARQNRERDLRVLGEEEAGDLALYIEEATYLLTEFGEGYQPEFADHKLVKVKR